jgi:hypothetical protein
MTQTSRRASGDGAVSTLVTWSMMRTSEPDGTSCTYREKSNA